MTPAAALSPLRERRAALGGAVAPAPRRRSARQGGLLPILTRTCARLVALSHRNPRTGAETLAPHHPPHAPLRSICGARPPGGGTGSRRVYEISDGRALADRRARGRAIRDPPLLRPASFLPGWMWPNLVMPLYRFSACRRIGVDAKRPGRFQQRSPLLAIAMDDGENFAFAQQEKIAGTVFPAAADPAGNPGMRGFPVGSLPAVVCALEVVQVRGQLRIFSAKQPDDSGERGFGLGNLAKGRQQPLRGIRLRIYFGHATEPARRWGG